MKPVNHVVSPDYTKALNLYLCDLCALCGLIQLKYHLPSGNQ